MGTLSSALCQSALQEKSYCVCSYTPLTQKGTWCTSSELRVTIATFPQACDSLCWWCHNNNVECHNDSYCSNQPHPLRRGSFPICGYHLTQINNIWPELVYQHTSLKHICLKLMIVVKLNVWVCAVFHFFFLTIR